MTFTYHRNFNCQSYDTYNCIKNIDSDENMAEDMHTYAVEWNEHRITWYVDGNPLLIRHKWFNMNGQEMDMCGNIPYAYYLKDKIYPDDNSPMWITAGLGVKENPTATFPAVMEIDYIRVYQRINSSSVVNICSNSDIIGSTVAGQEINVGGTNCNISVLDDEFLTLVAKDNIVIHSNFLAEEGAVFSMKIND